MRETKLTTANRQKWLILSATCLGAFMATLDASIVNIAMPKIAEYFHAPLASVEWVVLIYLLLISSLLLTYGRLGDMYGHKPIYVYGFAIFTLASALNSLAPTIGFLIGSRALQALGAGMLMAVVQAIIADNVNPSERGRAIGIQAMSVCLEKLGTASERNAEDIPRAASRPGTIPCRRTREREAVSFMTCLVSGQSPSPRFKTNCQTGAARSLQGLQIGD